MDGEFGLVIYFPESPSDKIVISEFFPSRTIKWILVNETAEWMDLSKPLELYPNKNGFYSGTASQDIFVFERGLIWLYMNGITKYFLDVNDILRIKNI